MTGPPRDWDKELAEIDKIMAKDAGAGGRAPGSGVPATVPARGAAPARAAAPSPPVGRRAALGTWVRVLLGVGVAVAVGFSWPYAHVCGVPLYGYLAASLGVALVGFWGAVASWKSRMGLAHLMAILATLTGLLLAGKVVLDRSGYPKVPSTWSCGP